MSKGPWHLRHIRAIVAVGLAASAVGIAVAASIDGTTATQVVVEGRQLFGLWALGLLLASMVAGPLAYVLPWLPVNGHLVAGRRVFGVGAFAFALLHACSYLLPIVTARDWPSLYRSGFVWVAGLLLGVSLLLALLALAATSTNRAVRALGPKRWKRLHQLVYLMLPLALVHAVSVGADFGFNKAPDVPWEADAGCLVGMCAANAGWLALFVMRRKGIRWTPSRLAARRIAGRG